MSRETLEDECEHRPTSGIAVIEDTLAETRGLVEELAEMARLKSVDWEEQRETIKVIADSIESRLEDAEFHLAQQLPDYQPIPSISTRDNPIVDTASGRVETPDHPELSEYSGPEIEF